MLIMNLLQNCRLYVDNELNTDENIKIKKMTISNPSARKRIGNNVQI